MRIGLSREHGPYYLDDGTLNSDLVTISSSDTVTLVS